MRRLLAFVLIYTSAFPQTSNSSSNQEESGYFVVHINVNRVQVDAVVTDAKGRSVTGLTAKDFEVLQDGIPQTITTFSYVAEGVKSSAAIESTSQPKSDSLLSAAPVRRTGQPIRRQIVLMVDDLGLSPTGVAYVRMALKKFIDRDMLPGDLIAIVRTAGDVEDPQFTTDKRVLYAAINQVKFHFMARSSFVPADLARSLEAPSIAGTSQNNDARAAEAEAAEKCFEDTNSSIGSLAAIRYFVQGLRNFPGRKSLILFSEKMQISDRADRANPSLDSDKGCDAYRTVQEFLRRVTDAAERSAVVIYTIDPHGLDPLVGDASSNPFANGPLRAGESPVEVINGQLKEMSVADSLAKSGLQQLADQTGGTFAFHNDTPGAIRDAVNDSSNYYLLGYRPPAPTFQGKDAWQRFHRVTVKVKRPDLRVRSRSGFYGVPGNGTQRGQPTTQNADVLLRIAARSAVENIGIGLSLNVSSNPLEWGPEDVVLKIDVHDIQFAQSDGRWHANLDVVFAELGKDNRVLGGIKDHLDLALYPDDYSEVAAEGWFYPKHVFVSPKAERFRVVVRDLATGAIGSASVPVRHNKGA